MEIIITEAPIVTRMASRCTKCAAEAPRGIRGLGGALILAQLFSRVRLGQTCSASQSLLLDYTRASEKLSKRNYTLYTYMYHKLPEHSMLLSWHWILFRNPGTLGDWPCSYLLQARVMGRFYCKR